MCLWHGDKEIVWSVTTTEQPGGFEPSHLMQQKKGAFKWHFFDSAALSKFKSVQSPAHIDI